MCTYVSGDHVCTSDSPSDYTTDDDISELKLKNFENIRQCAYPMHWDRIKFHDSRSPLSYKFAEDCANKQLHREYWWSENRKISSSICFEKQWSNYVDEKIVSSVEKCLMTEYEVIREVIWMLLGAKSSFVFGNVYDLHYFAVNIKTLRVCVNHLTHPTIDSILMMFFRCINNVLFLRKAVHYVTNSLDCVEFPCIFGYINCVNMFLSSFDEALQHLEKCSRGPKKFTLIDLHNQLLSWIRRTGILSGILTKVTAGQLSSLIKPSTGSRLLDALYYSMFVLESCSRDEYIIRFLQSAFVFTFQPFLCTVMQLLTNSCYSNSLLEMFAKVDPSIPVTNPKFWFSSIQPKNIIRSRINDDDMSCIPEVFHDVIEELVNGVKALLVLNAITEAFDDYTLQNANVNHFHDLKTFLRHLVLKATSCFSSEKANNRSLESETSTYVSSVRYFTRPEEVSLSALIITLQTRLQNFIHGRNMQINRQLLNVLLGPSKCVRSNFRSLGDCLVTISVVYLFSWGDRMNDFARNLFKQIRSSNSPTGDFVSLTLSLRQQFTKVKIGNTKVLTELNYFNFGDVEVESSKLSTPCQSLPIILLKSLKLVYYVEWPANIILTDAALDIYNGVFTFLLQIKFIKWNLEHLRFTSSANMRLMKSHSHNIYLLRSRMLFIFTSLHDFLAHRIEAIRIRFFRRWKLPDMAGFDFRISELCCNDTFSNLIQDHQALLSDLKSVCLLSDSSSLLRQEIEQLYSMALRLQVLWYNQSSAYGLCGSNVREEVKLLADQFDSHIKFLATMLSRSIRLSNVKQLLHLCNSFLIAASFPKDI